MYLNSFNHFRAVAIFFIVAGHCYALAGLQIDSFAEKVLKNLINGGTALFVFISGFLFYHIFYKKFEYRRFITTKAKSVLSPYILLGLLPVIGFTMMQSNGADGFFLPQGIGFIDEFLMPALKYFWTGYFLDAYWYIPFIMVTFVLSPLHIYFIKLKLPYQLAIIALLMGVSILMHRPILNLFVFQSVLYFTPIYLLGIVCSINQSFLYQKLAKKDGYLLFIAIALAVIQVAMGDVGNYHKLPFESAGVDILFIQKIFLCLFFMIWLNRFEAYENVAIKTVAATSFTTFFIHPLLLFILYRPSFEFMRLDSWWVYSALVIVLISVSVMVAITTKKLFPKFSRYMIGY